MLKERVEQDFLSRVSYVPSLHPTAIWGPSGLRGSPDPHPGHLQMTDCLTSIKSVNKTDALSLLTTFGVSHPWGCHPPWGTLGTGDASLRPSPTPQDPHLPPKPLTLLPIPQSLAAMVDASREDLSLCPGVGPQKVSDEATWGDMGDVGPSPPSLPHNSPCLHVCSPPPPPGQAALRRPARALPQGPQMSHHPQNLWFYNKWHLSVTGPEGG